MTDTVLKKKSEGKSPALITGTVLYKKKMVLRKHRHMHTHTHTHTQQACVWYARTTRASFRSKMASARSGLRAFSVSRALRYAKCQKRPIKEKKRPIKEQKRPINIGILGFKGTEVPRRFFFSKGIITCIYICMCCVCERV